MEYLELLKKALGRINKTYYGALNLTPYDVALLQPNKYLIREIVSYKERVFCYELYHQLRLIIESQKRNKENLDIWNHAFLQGEVQKNQLSNALNESLRVKQLYSVYIPDFVLHQPHTAQYQEFVMEVKAKPALAFKNFQKDILKLIEFVDRYKFEHAYFLVINNYPDDIFDKIKENKRTLGETIPQYEKHNVCKKIEIIVKEKFNTETKTEKLHNLICLKPFSGIPNRTNSQNNSSSK